MIIAAQMSNCTLHGMLKQDTCNNLDTGWSVVETCMPVHTSNCAAVTLSKVKKLEGHMQRQRQDLRRLYSKFVDVRQAAQKLLAPQWACRASNP